MGERNRKSASLLGPVLLLAIGCILLLNTLGVLEWSVWWTILRLWPILLIAAGLDLLLGRRSLWGALLAAVLVLGVLAGAFWLTQTATPESSASTLTIRQPLGSATEAEVVIEPAVGNLLVKALPEPANLIAGQIAVGRGEEISQNLAPQGDTVTYRLQSVSESWVPFTGDWNAERVWDLGLSPGATLQLRADLGVGKTSLDLTGLTLSSLDASTGLGQLEVILPAEGQLQGKLDCGIGKTVIVVPQGMALRIRADTAIASRDLPPELTQGEGNVYTSPGYATAQHRADLEVNQAIGALEVRYSD